MACRSFLFLQGMATPFFKSLGQAIRDRGHTVYRVRFCGGDRLFSIGQPGWGFNGTPEQLPQWLQARHIEHSFTDAVLFGDTRPLHAQAIPLLRNLGVRIHVFEEVYLRPNWITLEQDGVNGYSRLLSRPAEFWTDPLRPIADNVHIPGRKTLGIRGLYDISYHLASTLMQPWHRAYRTHRPYSALREYLGWARRLPHIKLRLEWQANRRIERLVADGSPYYLFPLQLDSDAQIRVHSPFSGMTEAIETILHSFAEHAPPESLLVIKNHPLDTGILKHHQTVHRLARQLDISQRVRYLEAGNLPRLLMHARGTVLVNSTTGTSALFHGSPTIALGTALFDLPGLTFQHGLDRFWTEGRKPDKTLFLRFRHTLIRHAQIAGDFYTRAGIRQAVQGSLDAMQLEAMPVAPATSPAVQVLPDNLMEPLAPLPAYGGKLPAAASGYLYKKT